MNNRWQALRVEPPLRVRLRVALGVLNERSDKTPAYRARCLEMPMLLRKCGLAATASFLSTDTVHGGSEAMSDVAKASGYSNAAALVERAVAAETPLREYLLVSAEVIAMAEAFSLLISESESAANDEDDDDQDML